MELNVYLVIKADMFFIVNQRSLIRVISCPQIKRLHSVRRGRTGYTQFVVLKLSTSGEKAVVLKNAHKLKRSNVFISDGFSERIKHK